MSIIKSVAPSLPHATSHRIPQTPELCTALSGVVRALGAIHRGSSVLDYKSLGRHKELIEGTQALVIDILDEIRNRILQ